MIVNTLKSGRRLVALAALGVVATSAFGFAASNNMAGAGSNAGDGTAGISGYTVSNVHYTLNATNPANIDSVSFGLAPAVPATGSVSARLVTGGSWFPCSLNGAGTVATCAVSGVTVAAADLLQVVAAQ